MRLSHRYVYICPYKSAHPFTLPLSHLSQVCVKPLHRDREISLPSNQTFAFACILVLFFTGSQLNAVVIMMMFVHFNFIHYFRNEYCQILMLDQTLPLLHCMALLLGKDECDVVNIIVYISILKEQNFLLVSIYIIII